MNACKSIFLVCAALFLVLLSVDISRAVDAWCEIPDRVSALEKTVDGLPDRVLPPVLAAVDKQAGAVLKRAGAIQSSADRRLDAIERDVRDLGYYGLAEVDQAVERADAQLAFANLTLRGGAIAIAQTSEHTNSLLDSYAELPDRMAATFRPSWEKIEPELTCRLADGSGYGGCWHSRVTALMGEAANVGGVFTKKFPAFADSTTGIATDVHTFTSRAVAPRGFWGNFKDFIATGSGVTRALGAAGLFEQRVAVPKQ